jgi:2-polyprenyl-3-methyl-5-hydroxy-6-metoxy-1,4-benzoquinol methylase
VVDAACGGGFGSAYLAEVAERVVGIELDDEMLAVARSSFPRANLEFRKHDLHEPLAIDEPLTLAVSFETLEHVRSPQQCLAVLAGALADDGVAVISVPNGQKELAAGDYKDYHERHFSADGFAQLLAGAFEQVEPRSQVYRKGLGHYVRKLTGRGGHHAAGYVFAPGFDEQAKTWLAICRRPRRGA